MSALAHDGRLRRVAVAAALWAVTTAVFFAFASRQRIVDHTPWNHFALLAEAWLHGRLDLGGPPPSYAGNNDFALHGGRWFVTFPPFPALLVLPLVAWGGRATEVQDGQFFLWLAGIGPAVLFLALEKLRRTGRSSRSVGENVVLSALFAFGTVYFFTAVQGTVWFAAHVVAVALVALYVLFALDAERPWLAGLMVGLGFMTRSPLLFAVPLFLYEAVRASTAPAEGVDASWQARLRAVDVRRVTGLVVSFAIPIAAVLALALWHNRLRFGNPFDFGYEYLQITWRPRMEKWGLFHYHYLARNLGVVVAGLPWWNPGGTPPIQVNTHGLALWVTTPFYLWLVWPRTVSGLHWALWATVAAVAVPTLFYQNTGWLQFGYRFSNDYAPLLIVLLAIGGRKLGWWFRAAALWAVAVNGFGAATFDRAKFARFYYQDNTQRTIFQPD